MDSKRAYFENNFNSFWLIEFSRCAIASLLPVVSLKCFDFTTFPRSRANLLFDPNFEDATGCNNASRVCKWKCLLAFISFEKYEYKSL